MKLRIEKSVVVITPSIGSPKLLNALESVEKQTHRNIKHLVVADGPEYLEKIVGLKFASSIRYQVTSTPDNTGKEGFYGHRIYAAYPHLVNADYVAFLDEDNWYEPDHIRSLVDLVEERNLHFAYSMRKIYDSDKNFLIEDNCESLGKWPIWFTHKQPQYHMDTSSYLFRRDFIKDTCHIWHHGWGGDRRYFNSVRDTNHTNTCQHTLCYRLDGNPGSVNYDFFKKGNEEQLKHYGGHLPWKKT